MESVKSAPWPGFECGMGIGGWLTNYKRFNVLPEDRRLILTDGDFAHFDSYITEGDVQRIARWGFDHIRLGFDQIVVEEEEGKYRERTFRKIDEFIGWCSKYSLNVVLNLHKAVGNYCDIPEKVQLLDDEGLQRRFIALWLEIERRYRDYPGVAFEILNEVRDVDPAKWNVLAERTIDVIRRENKDRWIVIGSTCWNAPHALGNLKVWDDPRIVYTFHSYSPFEFTHQRGVLQAGPLFDNADRLFPGAEAVEGPLSHVLGWLEKNPGKILWNGEFGTIRHISPPDRVAFMRTVTSFCKRHAIPYCVWNYLSTPNDGNRFSLVDDVTRDFLSDELQKACLGLGDASLSRELKFMTFNIWGPYFGNPVCERELKLASNILRNEPDLLALQESEIDFYASGFYKSLGRYYDIIRDGSNPVREHNPLLYRRDRLELIEGGTEVFAADSNPQGSKGFAWGVFRDKADGREFIAYSTHLMWSAPQFPRETTAHMRVENAREILAKISGLKAKYGNLPVVGGGDLNSTVNERAAGLESALAEWESAGFADAQYSVEGASPWSSHHGDPVRDSLGNLRAFFRPGSDDPKNSLDHVHYEISSVTPLTLFVDRAPDALETSDHSPVIFTFRLV